MLKSFARFPWQCYVTWAREETVLGSWRKTVAEMLIYSISTICVLNYQVTLINCLIYENLYKLGKYWNYFAHIQENTSKLSKQRIFSKLKENSHPIVNRSHWNELNWDAAKHMHSTAKNCYVPSSPSSGPSISATEDSTDSRVTFCLWGSTAAILKRICRKESAQN